MRSDAPVRVEGRRLREIRLRPGVAAAALGLLVIGFVLWVVSLLASSPLLAWLSGAGFSGAILVAGAHTWRRLHRRGKLLFGMPTLLLPIGFALAEAELPGAQAVGYVGAASLLAAIVLGVTARPAAGASLSLARASVVASLVRSEEPAASLTVSLGAEELVFEEEGAESPERWRLEEIASLRLEGSDPDRVLRARDRVEDEIAVQLAPASVWEAERLVARWKEYSPSEKPRPDPP
jgi:hypothetical protein